MKQKKIIGMNLLYILTYICICKLLINIIPCFVEEKHSNPHTITPPPPPPPPPCLTVGLMFLILYHSPSFHQTQAGPSLLKILNHNSSLQISAFHCLTVQFLLSIHHFN